MILTVKHAVSPKNPQIWHDLSVLDGNCSTGFTLYRIEDDKGRKNIWVLHLISALKLQ